MSEIDKEEVKWETVERLTRSLYDKIPYMSPQLMRTVIADYIRIAFESGYDTGKKE